jgi:hypothetical protein
MKFTHLFVKSFGWEVTIYDSNDFLSVELLDELDVEEEIYICHNKIGGKQICAVFDMFTDQQRKEELYKQLLSTFPTF